MSDNTVHRATPAERSGRIHRESVYDTKECYTEFHGWVLTCCWCDFIARGVTKVDAVAGMQSHYDQTCGKGRVEVQL